VSVILQAGQTALIRVAAGGGASGQFQLNINAGDPIAPPPVNDSCDQAVPLPAGVTLGTTVGATGGSISPCGVLDYADVWFFFDAPVTGTYRFDTFGSLGLIDSTLSLYNSCTSGECIGCNDNADEGGTYSRLGVALMAGERVLVRVAGHAHSEGSFVLSAARVPGPDQGACCAGSSCFLTDAIGCGDGQHFVGVACSAAPCPQPPGACCSGAACTMVATLGDCSGSFRGAGVACGQIDNPTACCPANFNQVSGVTVQDVFDFLAAYFAHQPAADFNQNGIATIQDIFDFLAAYFRGCT
jgi:hypothetical protein